MTRNEPRPGANTSSVAVNGVGVTRNVVRGAEHAPPRSVNGIDALV